MDAGQIKATFYDEDHKVVKLPEVVFADGSVKSNGGSFSLKNDDKVKDSINIAAIDDSVRYLKVEAVSTGLNAYHIGMLG